MSHAFVSQPVAGGYDPQEFVENACADLSVSRLDFAVAWAKRGGVLGIRSVVEGFRARGRTVRGIVGISLGGTSKQALILLRDLCDQLYVFHEPGTTFHPKVDLATGRSALARRIEQPHDRWFVAQLRGCGGVRPRSR